MHVDACPTRRIAEGPASRTVSVIRSHAMSKANAAPGLGNGGGGDDQTCVQQGQEGPSSEMRRVRVGLGSGHIRY